MTKIDYGFAELSLEELVKFCEQHDKDWDKDVPEWSGPMEKHLKRAFAKERFGMTLCELETVDSRLGKIQVEYIDDSLRDAMDKSRPLGYIWDTIAEMKFDMKRHENSLKVLLLKDKDEPSGATVGQMNTIKGGIPIQ